MFLKNYQTFFLVILMTGSIIAVSSNSWFTSWVGLEINLMSMIPLILSELNFKSTEAAIKYFLSQALASVTLISTACFSALFEMSIYMASLSGLILMSLAIKSGLAPFHLWFPQVMNCVSWFKCTLILTWQKIAPFMLLSVFSNKNGTCVLIYMAVTIGALGGLNQVDTKMILTYSSIAHSAWMLAVSFTSLMYWLMYFFMYVFILLPIIIYFLNSNLIKMTNLNKTKMNNLNKNTLIFLVLSLGGMPPFLGFSAKLVVFITMMNIIPFMILIFMVSSSLLSLFYYTKLFYNMTMNSMPEMKMNIITGMKSNNKMAILSTIGNMGLSLMVLLI